jgi:hypothetical protein
VNRPVHRLSTALAAVALAAVVGSCSAPAAGDGRVKAIYSPTTGRLTELTLDRNGDGHIDTRAFMDGTHVERIEIDRQDRGRTDRWEYYEPGTPAAGSHSGAGAAFDQRAVLVRAEEANGPDGKTITRREFYTNGVIARVEEDTDFDGRVDKWEYYEQGALVRMDLDLTGRGAPDRRFLYRADGSLDHVEVDASGSGHFVAAPPTASAGAAGATAGSGRR